MSIPVFVSQPQSQQTDPGVTALVMLLRFHGVGADPAQILHRFGPRIGVPEMLRCAKELGLRAARSRSEWERLAGTPLCRASRSCGTAASSSSARWQGQGLRPVPAQRRARRDDAGRVRGGLDGDLVLMTRRAAASSISRAASISPGSWAQSTNTAAPRRGAGRLLLPAVVRAGLAAVLPGRHRQGAGASQPEHARRAGARARQRSRSSRRSRRHCAPICSRTPPTASMSSSAPGFSAICWRCRSPISRRGASATSVARVRELENIRNFLTSSALTLVIDLVLHLRIPGGDVLLFAAPDLGRAGSLPFYIAISAGATPLFRRRLDEKFQRGAENQAFLVESVTGVETLKAMAVEPQMQRRWEEQLAGYVAASFRVLQPRQHGEPGGPARSASSSPPASSISAPSW